MFHYYNVWRFKFHQLITSFTPSLSGVFTVLTLIGFQIFKGIYGVSRVEFLTWVWINIYSMLLVIRRFANSRPIKQAWSLLTLLRVWCILIYIWNLPFLYIATAHECGTTKHWKPDERTVCLNSQFRITFFVSWIK